MTIELSAMFRASRAKNRGNPRGVRIARRRGMDPAEFDRLITRAEDPRLIPGIYNYCDGRCPRCRFSERCLTFLDNRDLESSRRAPSIETMGASLQRTLEIITEVARRDCVDLEPITDADEEEAADDP